MGTARTILRHDATRATLVGAIAVAVGQVLLVLIAPLTRASADGITQAGIGLVSPDGETYLRMAESPYSPESVPWNRALLILILRAGTILGAPEHALVLTQITLLVLATALTHRTAERIAGRSAGIVAAAVVAVNPLTAQWARFVLSETLMLSLVLIGLWAAERLLRGVLRHGALLLLTPAVLATFLRPNGILLLGSALTVLIIHRPRRHAGVLVAMTWTGVALGLTLGLLATGQPAERTFAEQLRSGTVIEGTEDVRVTLTMPPSVDVEDVSNIAAVRYVVAEPIAVARLAAVRITTEAAQVRRHYPTPVNIAIGSAMLGFAVATAIGAWSTGSRTLRTAALIIGLPMLLLVGATFATPEGRYGWAGLITAAPLAGIGVARVLDRLSASGQANTDEAQPSDGPGTAR